MNSTDTIGMGDPSNIREAPLRDQISILHENISRLTEKAMALESFLKQRLEDTNTAVHTCPTIIGGKGIRVTQTKNMVTIEAE